MTAARTWLVPEVLQTSTMDCGPAALQAVLEGLGIAASYDALRARCATDVDGTSLSALARLGAEIGLRTREALVSRDALLLPEARCLPAIVVASVPGGGAHFLVVWRRFGPLVQIMDPGGGRRWLSWRRCLALLTDHQTILTAARFRKWSATEIARGPSGAECAPSACARARSTR